MTPERYLPDIASKSWEHPLDRAALAAFRTLPGAEALMKAFIGFTSEKSIRLLSLASSARVSETQFPGVYRQVLKACEILDIQDIPEVFVSQNPFFNAGIVGVRRPVISLNSSLIDVLEDHELLGVIGHELGHCLSGHMVYKTLYWFLLNISAGALSSIPLGMIAIQALIAALAEWDRKSELSADRAGLLVTQDSRASISLLMKMSGGGRIEEMDVNEFFKQAKEYDEAGDVIDSIYKFLGTINQTHPFPVVRLTELIKWEKSGEYQSILNGNYVRRADEKKEDDFFKDFSRAADSYSRDFRESDDPLARFASDVSRQAENVQAGLESFLSRVFKPRNGGNDE